MEKKPSDSGSGDRVTTSSTSEADSAGSVTVTIAGQKLPIRSDQDPEFVQEIADYVSEKIERVRESAPQVPTDKQVMLASMSVAEDLLEARDENRRLRSELEERAETLSDLLAELRE